MDYVAHAKKLLSGQSASSTSNSNGAIQPQKSSSLDGVVNTLVRAAIGGEALAEEDVDKYIAELIMKEAKAKNKKYQEVGISAYTEPERNVFKPNKRFMQAVIQQTDNHNKALLKYIHSSADKLLREMETTASSDDGSNRTEEIRFDGYDNNGRKGRMRAFSPSDSEDHFHDLALEDGRTQDASIQEEDRTMQAEMEFKSRKRRRNEYDEDGDRQNHKSIDTRGEAKSRDRLSPSSSRNIERLHQNNISSKGSSPTKAAIKGRGAIGSSRLDKFFQPDYDPRLDMDNFDETNLDVYVGAVEELAKGVSNKEPSEDFEEDLRDYEGHDKKSKHHSHKSKSHKSKSSLEPHRKKKKDKKTSHSKKSSASSSHAKPQNYDSGPAHDSDDNNKHEDPVSSDLDSDERELIERERIFRGMNRRQEVPNTYDDDRELLTEKRTKRRKRRSSNEYGSDDDRQTIGKRRSRDNAVASESDFEYGERNRSNNNVKGKTNSDRKRIKHTDKGSRGDVVDSEDDKTRPTHGDASSSDDYSDERERRGGRRRHKGSRNPPSSSQLHSRKMEVGYGGFGGTKPRLQLSAPKARNDLPETCPW